MSITAFHEGRLPVSAGPGSSGGPEWHTQTLVLASGREVRNAVWRGPRQRWDIVSAPLASQAVRAVLDFFEARRGRLQGFRFRDSLSFSTAQSEAPVSALDEVIAAGDGETTVFQLTRSTAMGPKRICKPVASSVQVAIDGGVYQTGWSVDERTGLLTFDVPPSAGTSITAGFDYDWPVRFDTDELDVTLTDVGAGQLLRIPLIELLPEDAL